MKPTLVTGATGFVGWHVARLLIERGHCVRALARDPARLRELNGVEAIRGDLRDPGSLQAAAAGCGLVFHVAADYRLWARDTAGMYRTNVEGTRNLLEAARHAGVERVVYTSTVGCIGVPGDGGLGDESRPVALADMTGAYKRSKFQAEQVALEFAAAGFPVVVVNPTAPVGGHDVKPTPTGKIIVDYLKGGMPAYIDTGLNLVDVRDVALGHLLAAERGQPGERYILGARNMTLEEIFGALQPLTGIKAPTVRIPYLVALAAGVITTAWARLSGAEPRAPLDAVRMARKKMFVTHQKAALDLGFAPGPIEDALRRAVEWFRTNRYC
jgi:dihydroflavonol-4-reductase